MMFGDEREKELSKRLLDISNAGLAAIKLVELGEFEAASITVNRIGQEQLKCKSLLIGIAASGRNEE